MRRCWPSSVAIDFSQQLLGAQPAFGPKTQQCVDLFAAELGGMDWDEQVAVAKLSQHCGEGTMPLPR